ncbi:MAG: endonuclease/exonuclease/phosphatase family protein [Patescibacteria group bacterium]
MRIYSWNMLFRNRELDRAFEFISRADFDIFCLQEVPEKFLKRLKTLPFNIADTIDVERLFSQLNRNHLVILTPHAIEKRGTLMHPDYWQSLQLRARLFVRCMRLFHWSKIQNRSTLFADVNVVDTLVRVFNLHIAIMRPDWRLREFERAMAERDQSRPTIVCGDFNVLESAPISVLNWFVGGRISDAMRFRHERRRLETRFLEYELTNPLRGKITHPFSRSQLDHILVSNTFSIKNATVLTNRYGSDHHPIFAEIE